ncbi:MAG: C40 family peptidase [Desulfobacteraceae bacterium]|nr:C40 family peptidase [Desulfobacteraceae bacterium]
MFSIDAITEAREHAAREYPAKESCGLIFDGRYIPLENLAVNPSEDFKISPEVYLSYCELGTVEAVMHSHPNGPQCPTKLDMIGQEACNVPWGIVPILFGSTLYPFFWGDQLPIAPLVGRQFRMGVFDCYGLVRDWYRQERSTTLPLFPRDPDWWTNGEDMIADNFRTAGFVEVPEVAKVGDVVVGKILARVENHCAVYIGDGLILHHLAGRLSRREALGPWMRYKTRVFRHENLL